MGFSSGEDSRCSALRSLGGWIRWINWARPEKMGAVVLLFRGFVGDEILPSYVVIRISQQEDSF